MKRLASLTALLAVAAGLVAAPAASAAKPSDDQRVTVMSRNLFLGVDIRRAVAATTPEELGQVAIQLYNEVEATDVPGRMDLVADEIEAVDPDLVGLQEVTTWSTGARTLDYLQLLRKALKKRGLSYRVEGQEDEADVSLPTPEGTGSFELGNAVLVKKGVKTSGVKTGVYKSQIGFPTATDPSLRVRRNWASMKATVGEAKFRFVNTHLEAYSNPEKLAQARELVAGPLKGRGPLIMTGDLNSNANLEDPADRPPFVAVRRAGLVVAQTSRQTCCLNDDLKTGVRDHTVDFIMTKPRMKVVRSGLTGTRATTSAGTQAADHAGVWSTLLVP